MHEFDARSVCGGGHGDLRRQTGEVDRSSSESPPPTTAIGLPSEEYRRTGNVDTP